MKLRCPHISDMQWLSVFLNGHTGEQNVVNSDSLNMKANADIGKHRRSIKYSANPSRWLLF
jgi:hypothetical protein